MSVNFNMYIKVKEESDWQIIYEIDYSKYGDGISKSDCIYGTSYEKEGWGSEFGIEGFAEEVVEKLGNRVFILIKAWNSVTDDCGFRAYLGEEDILEARAEDFWKWISQYFGWEDEAFGPYTKFFHSIYIYEDGYIPEEYEQYFKKADEVESFRPLDKTFVIKGYCCYGSKKIEEYIKKNGGYKRQEVSGKTNFLIMGLKDGFSKKLQKRAMEKAISNIEKGLDTIIISDMEFRKLMKRPQPKAYLFERQ